MYFFLQLHISFISVSSHILIMYQHLLILSLIFLFIFAFLFSISISERWNFGPGHRLSAMDYGIMRIVCHGILGRLERLG